MIASKVVRPKSDPRMVLGLAEKSVPCFATTTLSALLFAGWLWGAVPVHAGPKSAPPTTEPKLSQSQWDSLFRAAAKRIASIEMKAVVEGRGYITKAQANASNDLSRRRNPGAFHRISAGYTKSQRRRVSLKWNVPAGLLYARTIGLAGTSSTPVGSIVVYGRRSAWWSQVFPSGCSVYISRRGSSWSNSMWGMWYNDFGLITLHDAWTPLQMISGEPPPYHANRRYLISQKYDPATGLIKLVYVRLKHGKPVDTPTFIPRWGVRGIAEGLYTLKLRGGLRIYQKLIEVVTGHRQIPQSEADFSRFKRINGIWFPMKIRDRFWFHRDGALRLAYDDRLKISQIAINRVFPKRTFRYTPPFGARVVDLRTDPPTQYFVGSKNPLLPPSAAVPNKKGSQEGKR
jgi:hypothetical protein